jgi:hypothetical protein
MKFDRQIKVQLCFVKAYFTLRTATQAVARDVVNSLFWARYPSRRKAWPTGHEKVLVKKAYRRLKPIIAKIFARVQE